MRIESFQNLKKSLLSIASEILQIRHFLQNSIKGEDTMVQTRSGARRARTESFGYQTPFLVSREFEKYERKFMIALQSVDFSPLHMAMKLVGQCCSGEVLVLYFAVLYWVVDQRYVFFFFFSLFSLFERFPDDLSPLAELVWTQFGWFL